MSKTNNRKNCKTFLKPNTKITQKPDNNTYNKSQEQYKQ